MTYLLREFDPIILCLILVPCFLAAAAWALKMACSFCSVDAPDFAQALTCVLAVCVGNIFLRYGLHSPYFIQGLGTQVIAPLIITSIIVALFIRTGPFSALVVTLVQACICGAIYFAVDTVTKVVLA